MGFSFILCKYLQVDTFREEEGLIAILLNCGLFVMPILVKR